MKFKLTKAAQDFIARYLGDISKTIVAVGIASYFFKDMPLLLRLGLLIAPIVLFAISVIIIEKKGD